MVKISNNHVLALLAAALTVACGLSICAPMRFDKQQAERGHAVKARLVQIRRAQEKYRKANGAYAPDLSLLVKEGLLADSLQYIPYSGGRKFDLATTVHATPSGRTLPLMECGAQYADYLRGLDPGAIANLAEQANNAGTYPGLKIGDLNTPNNNAGNWE